MADSEQADGGAAEGAAPKSKLKLVIIVVGALALIGGGAASYFLFFGHSGEEKHAEARRPSHRPSSKCRTCWSTSWVHRASACNI